MAIRFLIFGLNPQNVRAAKMHEGAKCEVRVHLSKIDSFLFKGKSMWSNFGRYVRKA